MPFISSIFSPRLIAARLSKVDFPYANKLIQLICISICMLVTLKFHKTLGEVGSYHLNFNPNFAFLWEENDGVRENKDVKLN